MNKYRHCVKCLRIIRASGEEDNWSASSEEGEEGRREGFLLLWLLGGWVKLG